MDERRPWRNMCGGMWDELGSLQFDYLVSQGLKPEHRLLDVGCGCLRAGVRLIPYLAEGHYYGIDKKELMLAAGRLALADEGVADRPVHLLCRGDFDCSAFGVRFDFAIAQSVFTHLPWNSILRCLVEVRAVLAPAGKLYATFFEDADGSHKTSKLAHHPGGIVTFPDKNPYHYEFSVFEDLGRRAGFEAEYVGEWNHPRAQRMMVFRQAPAAARGQGAAAPEA